MVLVSVVLKRVEYVRFAAD